jgi:PAS domain S-box-containing protein
LAKEIFIKTSFAKERWLQVICTTFWSADDTHILLMFEDITVRKEIELALKRYTDEISDLYNHAPCGYHSLDSEGVIIKINDTELDWIGYSPDEIIGKKKFTDIITPDSKITFQENYPGFKERGYVKDLEFDIIRKDGSILPILLNATAIKDGAGNFLMSRSTLFDITDRKQAEEALKKSEERFALAMQGANEGLWDWNIATHEMYFSPRWKTMLGYSDEELKPVRQDWENLIFEEDRDRFNTANRDYLAGKTDRHEVEFRMVHKDGHLVYILSRAFMVRRDSDGRPARLVGTHSDITDRKRAEEALFQANKKINMLSSITRHDILNQVMGLRTYIALTKDMTTDKELQEYIGKEDEIADDIQRQIEFTRYYQDIGVQSPTWQDAGIVITSAARQLDLPGISFENTMTDIEIFADPLIEKVFHNLLENTLRHGEHVRAIRFSAQETDEGLILTYHDDGVGITAEDKTRLFQRGFGKHTGLGLFLSREILSITGIAIRENGEPGKGVNFEIVVPKDRYRHTG